MARSKSISRLQASREPGAGPRARLPRPCLTAPVCSGIVISMDGLIRTYGRCETCAIGWTSDGTTAPRCGCGLEQPGVKSKSNPRPGDVFLDVNRGGTRSKIFGDRDRQSFRKVAKEMRLSRMDTWKVAAATLTVVRSEIVKGIKQKARVFRPDNYRSAPPSGLTFGGYALALIEKWETSADPKERRAKGYTVQVRGYLNNHLAELAGEDIREIEHAQLDGLRKDLAANGVSKRNGKAGGKLSDKTICNLVTFAHSVLVHAAQAGDRERAPVLPKLAFDTPDYVTYEREETER